MLPGGTGVLLHHLHRLLVRSEQNSLEFGLVESVLGGDRPNGRITRIHVRPSFSSMDLFVNSDKVR